MLLMGVESMPVPIITGEKDPEPIRRGRVSKDRALIRLTLDLERGESINIPERALEEGVDRATVFRWMLKMRDFIPLVINRKHEWQRADKVRETSITSR